VNGAVGAHGHGRAEGVGAFCGAGGNGEDLADGVFALAEADGFFDGELVEGVEGVFDAAGFYAGLGFVDAGFDLGWGEGELWTGERGKGDWRKLWKAIGTFEIGGLESR
jgi:hypothetical protein